MTRVTIIVPCFNEEPGVHYLSERLRPALSELRRAMDVELIFVDDGSRDATFDRLTAEFHAVSDVRFVRHERNLGITAAIQSGASAARGEIVCTIDSDMSYDPMILTQLIEPIASGRADVVTASPYHPRGAVMNAPRWRLLLSRGASWIYRQILPLPLYTFTSCCRAYRASVGRQLTFSHPGFLGVTEMLVSAILAGLRVAEVPALLQRRRYGSSKMRTLQTIGGHLRLILQLSTRRLHAGFREGVTHGSL